MLIDELKKANLIALKEHDADARAALSVAINRYMLVNIENKSAGKETTDADVVRILSKLAKELDEEKEGYIKVGNKERELGIIKQKEVIEKYLPKMMSVEEIKQEIAKLEDKSIPSVMKYFKEHHNGECDMALVSKVARE